jgi:GNAT superfamily N-acetyltransferase
MDNAQYVRKASNALSRVQAGQKCFVATHEGRLIGKAWVAEVSTWFISEVETNEPIGQGAVVIFDCATIPEYRGKRVYPAMLRHINDEYLDRRKVIYCEAQNGASLRGIARDFRLEKRMYLFRICGIDFRWTRLAKSLNATATSSDGGGGGVAPTGSEGASS